MKRIILVLEPFCREHMDRIKMAAGDEFTVETIDKYYDEELLADALKRAEIVVGAPPMELIAHPGKDCPNLRFIQMVWAGTDMYSRNTIPFPSESISLANGSGAYGLIISQYVVGMILSLMLNFKDYHNQQLNKVWERRLPMQSLDHAQVLIYGAGNIGSVTAKRLKGFDAHTIGVCRNTDSPRQYFDELCTLDDAEKYLSNADVVIGCLPNTADTEGYFDSRRLHLMKQNSVLVNVGRGNFVDCMALDKVLREGLLRGAALDVTDPEPLPTEHPLWDNPNCIITPHSSGPSFHALKATEDLICDIVCENITRYINNDDIINKVDFA